MDKNVPFIKVAIFSNVTFVSNCRDWEEKAVSLIPCYMIYMFHKIVKGSHLKQLRITEIINNLMFRVIFIFSD